jgi:hypothetical protein
MDHPTDDGLPPVRLLRCLKCGNTVECKPADLLRFTKTKWLRCCDEVMTLFTPTTPPTQDSPMNEFSPE